MILRCSRVSVVSIALCCQRSVGVRKVFSLWLVWKRNVRHEQRKAEANGIYLLWEQHMRQNQPFVSSLGESSASPRRILTTSTKHLRLSSGTSRYATLTFAGAPIRGRAENSNFGDLLLSRAPNAADRRLPYAFACAFSESSGLHPCTFL